MHASGSGEVRPISLAELRNLVPHPTLPLMETRLFHVINHEGLISVLVGGEIGVDSPKSVNGKSGEGEGTRGSGANQQG